MSLYLIHIVNGSRIPSSRHSIFSDSCKKGLNKSICLLINFYNYVLTCQNHPLVQTLLESTILTSIPLSLVDFTISICNTVVNPFVLHRSLEESLAAFAGDDAVVQTSGLVFADHADQRFFFLLLFHCLVRIRWTTNSTRDLKEKVSEHLKTENH